MRERAPAGRSTRRDCSASPRSVSQVRTNVFVLACAYVATCLCLVSPSLAACHAHARAVGRTHEWVRCWMHVRKDVIYKRVLSCFVYVSMSMHAGAIATPPHPRPLASVALVLLRSPTHKHMNTQCRGRRCVRGGGAGFSQESEQGNRGKQDHQRVTA